MKYLRENTDEEIKNGTWLDHLVWGIRFAVLLALSFGLFLGIAKIIELVFDLRLILGG